MWNRRKVTEKRRQRHLLDVLIFFHIFPINWSSELNSWKYFLKKEKLESFEVEWDVFGVKYVSVVRRLLQLNLESVLPPPPKNVHFDAIFRLVSDRRIECRPCLSFFFLSFLRSTFCLKLKENILTISVEGFWFFNF